MNNLLKSGLLLFTTASSLQAATIDDYYLQRFGYSSSVRMKSAGMAVDAAISQQPHCGTPLKKQLKHDWGKLSSSTQKVLAKEVAYPLLGGISKTYNSEHFTIHYTTTGSNAVSTIDINLNSVPDFVDTVAATFEDVYSYYSFRNYRMPPTNDGKFHIYLENLAPQSLYGLTTSDYPAPAAGYPYAYTSYMELDNNFTDSSYVNANGGPYTALQSLQITAAHEFHHAIQYSYNYYFDIWYGEATSSWFEDEQYDAVNQIYNYLGNWFKYSTLSLDTAVGSDALSTGAGYSRWLFNRYLAEEYGADIIRQFWEKLAPLSSPLSGGDIQMVPVLNSVLSSYKSTVGDELLKFTKKTYLKSWATHTAEVPRIPAMTPINTYYSYPAGSSVIEPYINLAALSFSSHRFVPSANLFNLNVAVPAITGIKTVMFLNKNGVVEEVLPSGSVYTIPGFGNLNSFYSEAIMIAVNTNSASTTIGVTTTGATTAVTTTTATTQQISPVVATVSTSGGGGGCFIATAAYGSYLHPQVQVLRDFRDKHLLTSSLGKKVVALYYTISPPVADFISGSEALKLLVRVALTPLLLAIASPVAATALLLLSCFAILLRVRRRTI